MHKRRRIEKPIIEITPPFLSPCPHFNILNINYARARHT
jgi:hypothetical protein